MLLRPRTLCLALGTAAVLAAALFAGLRETPPAGQRPGPQTAKAARAPAPQASEAQASPPQAEKPAPPAGPQLAVTNVMIYASTESGGMKTANAMLLLKDFTPESFPFLIVGPPHYPEGTAADKYLFDDMTAPLLVKRFTAPRKDGYPMQGELKMEGDCPAVPAAACAVTVAYPTESAETVWEKLPDTQRKDTAFGSLALSHFSRTPGNRLEFTVDIRLRGNTDDQALQYCVLDSLRAFFGKERRECPGSGYSWSSHNGQISGEFNFALPDAPAGGPLAVVCDTAFRKETVTAWLPESPLPTFPLPVSPAPEVPAAAAGTARFALPLRQRDAALPQDAKWANGRSGSFVLETGRVETNFPIPQERAAFTAQLTLKFPSSDGFLGFRGIGDRSRGTVTVRGASPENAPGEVLAFGIPHAQPQQPSLTVQQFMVSWKETAGGAGDKREFTGKLPPLRVMRAWREVLLPLTLRDGNPVAPPEAVEGVKVASVRATPRLLEIVFTLAPGTLPEGMHPDDVRCQALPSGIAADSRTRDAAKPRIYAAWRRNDASLPQQIRILIPLRIEEVAPEFTVTGVPLPVLRKSAPRELF